MRKLQRTSYERNALNDLPVWDEIMARATADERAAMELEGERLVARFRQRDAKQARHEQSALINQMHRLHVEMIALDAGDMSVSYLSRLTHGSPAVGGARVIWGAVMGLYGIKGRLRAGLVDVTDLYVVGSGIGSTLETVWRTLVPPGCEINGVDPNDPLTRGMVTGPMYRPSKEVPDKPPGPIKRAVVIEWRNDTADDGHWDFDAVVDIKPDVVIAIHSNEARLSDELWDLLSDETQWSEDMNECHRSPELAPCVTLWTKKLPGRGDGD